MVRLIWILILMGIVYWVVKRAFFPKNRRPARPEELGEEMAQDPVCGCYIPKSQALTLASGSKQLYFCSQACFQKYQSSDALPKN
jgi:uncharacterized protein